MKTIVFDFQTPKSLLWCCVCVRAIQFHVILILWLLFIFPFALSSFRWLIQFFFDVRVKNVLSLCSLYDKNRRYLQREITTSFHHGHRLMLTRRLISHEQMNCTFGRNFYRMKRKWLFFFRLFWMFNLIQWECFFHLVFCV